MAFYCYRIEILFLSKVLLLRVFLKKFVNFIYYSITISSNCFSHTYLNSIIGFASYSSFIMTLLSFFSNFSSYLY